MNLQVIKNRLRKVLAYSVTSILFLLIAGFLFLQMPPVQKWLVNYYLKDFSSVTGFPAEIKGFKMLWFDRLELTGVTVYDPEGNKMIRAGEILVNFRLAQLIDDNGDVRIDGVYIDSAHVFLTNINENDTSRDLNMNVFIFRINQMGSSGGGGAPPKVNIGEAFLNRSQFTFINQDRDSVKNGFNYNQFSLAVDEGQLKGFEIIGDTTQFLVRTLIAEDKDTKFKVKQLSTYFRLSQKAMEFDGLDLRAGESVVRDTIRMYFNRQPDLNDFITKVRVHANITNTILHHNDLALFAPGVELLGQPVHMQGVIDGKVNKFKVSDMDIILGDTRLKGTLDMDGLPEITETFIILNLKDSQLDPFDLGFILKDDVLERFGPMGKMHIDGQFLGYPTDFVANGTLIGRLGTIRSDINFKVNEKDFNRSEYSGKLVLKSFSIGKYLNDTATFQSVTLDGKIAGSGLTKEKADFKLDGRISKVGIKGYDYQNIRTDARFAAGLFSGFAAIDDPNLEMEAKGSVDLRGGKNRIRIEARLDTAFLHHLKLSKDEIFLHSTFTADVEGLTLDSVQGTAAFQDVNVSYKDKSMTLDQISLEAWRDGDNHTLRVESTIADLEIKGNYLLSRLGGDVETLAHEIELNIRNDRREIREYYRKKKKHPENYEANLSVLLKDLSPVSNLLNTDFRVSPQTRVQGTFTSGYTTIISAYTSIDTLEYEGNMFINTEADLNTSKISDSTTVLSMLTITSERQSFGKALETKNLLAEGIWSKSHIDFEVDADQVGQTNYMRLAGDVDFLADSTLIRMAPSSVKLLEREWTFAPLNFISFRKNEITFNKLSLNTGEQSIQLNGRLSTDPERLLTVKVNELDLSLFNVLTTKKIKGVMNAQVDLSNFFRRMNIQNTLRVTDFTVNDFLIGDIAGQNIWDTTGRKFNIDVHVTRDNHRLVNVEGDYKPRRASPLALNAKLLNADLKIVEPFLTDIFSRIGGTVSGDFTIAGQLHSPEINGEGLISDGQLMVDYLRTMYRFRGIIGMSTNSIYFRDIEMTDAFRNTGQLNGEIRHKGFNSMVINLNSSFRNFQVLNTSLKDNDLFYGQAYATGNVKFSGPIANLSIESTARTEKNTRIYVPISGSSTVEKKDFISFVNLRDSTGILKKEFKGKNNKVNLTGITFDLNLDVTPDAYCEIIFDLKAGDIIRGRGNGDLKLQMDTKGDFSMFGPFEFTEGWYNFTLYDIINKEFEIQRGSKITWYGDPYQGILNINASYNQLASLAPLIMDPNLANSQQVRRKYPVQVLLKIEGQMLAFNVSFDIQARDLPKNVQAGSSSVNLEITFAAFKNRLDEQELYRQVFSLIVLRRFSPPESFNTSGSVVNSVSELLSNQLSYWMSQVDENLEIDVDLGMMDDEAFSTFQLRFSYTFLNGRLRVTGDGTFNNSNNAPAGPTQANPSSVAGDWTVDYMLTADGKLRVKMYSRTNVNPILTSLNNQNTITTGASLIHTQSFDQIRDLWKSTRRRSKKQTPQEETSGEAIKEDEDAME